MADTGFIRGTSNLSTGGFTNAANLLDGASGLATATGAGSRVAMTGHDWSSIPAGSTIDGVEIKVMYGTTTSSTSVRFNISLGATVEMLLMFLVLSVL